MLYLCHTKLFTCMCPSFFYQKWIYLEYSYWLKLSNYKTKTKQWKESRQETSQILEHCRNHNKIGLISSKSTGFKGIPRIKSNTHWSVLCKVCLIMYWVFTIQIGLLWPPRNEQVITMHNHSMRVTFVVHQN